MPSLRDLGIALGAVVGLFLFQIGYAIVWQAIDPTGFAQISDASNILLGDMTGLAGALTIGLAAALGEELIFRGALLPPFRLLLTSVLFTIIHSQYGLSPAAGIIFAIALVLGLAALSHQPDRLHPGPLRLQFRLRHAAHRRPVTHA